MQEVTRFQGQDPGRSRRLAVAGRLRVTPPRPSVYREPIQALTRLPIIARASLMGIGGLSGGARANGAWRALSPLAA